MNCFFFVVSAVHIISQYAFYHVHNSNRGFRAATISAVTAATKRSMQLGGTSDKEIQNKYGL